MIDFAARSGAMVITRSVAEVASAPELIAAWQSVLDVYPHFNSLYASPEWVSGASTDRLHIAFVGDESGSIIGVVPLRVRPFDLRFDVANTELFSRTLQVAEVLGSVPLLPKSAEIHRRVIDAIFHLFPECAGLLSDSVPVDSYFWSFLHDRQAFSGSSYLHIADGPRPWHLLTLSASFGDYLKSLSSKSRANMRREVRQLADRAGGELQAVRVSAPKDVPQFLERAVRVAKNSWQARALGERVRCDEASCRKLEDHASRGLLRSYVLQAADASLAFVIGYQYLGVYHYVEVAYDETHADHSPGKVLLTLMLEDLHEYQRPETVNFGVGDASYKRRFGNLEKSDAGCLILRNRFSNRVATTSHNVFSAAVRTAKKLVGRRVAK
jgi:CelD/BcsL family acetyltransferase involved in cellulose biosynthesis